MISVVSCVDKGWLFYYALCYEVLGNLYGIECCALLDLVTHNPEGKSILVGEILADAVLLGDSEKVDLSITDFDLDSSTGSCSVTVELKLGGMAKQLKAAKEAFAGKVRLGATLKGMSPATESDIVTATLSGNRVKLSVKMPSGESGFVTIKID